MGLDAAGTQACYDQSSDPTGASLSATQFLDGNDPYSTYAAEDILLNRRCKVHDVRLYGVFSNGAPANPTFKFTVETDAGGVPSGKRVPHMPPPPPPCTTFPWEDYTDCIFDFVVPAHQPVWLVVTYEGDDSAGPTADDSSWYWDTTTDSTGYPGVWENPGDGYGTGCTKWAPIQQCVGGGGSGLMFTLLKSRK